MIGEAELRRQAAQWRVDPMVVDLDYSLGWFIAALYEANENVTRLYFKGGTCLRKCYFGDYRFSEDLDFTADLRLDPEQLLHWIAKAADWSAERDGPNYEIAAPRVETLEDEYGSETFQVRVYYRGPLQWGGSPRAVRLDVTRDETLLFPSENRSLLHPYSDANFLNSAIVACYGLTEILAEKIRAVGGQRRFAISRDLYDIHHLLHAGVSVADTIPALSAKFAARGVDLAMLDVQQFMARRDEFAADWQRRLSYLVREVSTLDFDAAWRTSIEVLQHIEQSLQVSNQSKEDTK
jgi:predicted nucleotidyltransferase component of viral defense system